jgi:arylsulfatase A-like enzyme
MDDNPKLIFGIGIEDEGWAKGSDGVGFSISIRPKAGPEEAVFDRFLNPRDVPDDRHWVDATVDLSRFAGQQVDVVFRTRTGPTSTYDWAGWSNPILSKDQRLAVPKTEHTNVVLVTLDTVRADHLGCYGSTEVKTPNIDRLAGRGALFAYTTSQCSTTNPSHASIFTSQYPKTHGVLGNADHLSESESLPTMAEVFKRNGYATAAATGVWTLGAKYSGFGRGFDSYFDNSYQPMVATDPESIVDGTITNQKIYPWLEQHRGDKFFLWVHYYDAHAPYDPPEPYRSMYYQGDPRDEKFHSMDEVVYNVGWSDPPDWLRGIRDLNFVRSMYKGGVSYVDAIVGNLLDTLSGLGLADNTLIVLTADHGEHLGDHGIYFDHWGLQQSVIKVPLIVVGPRIPSGLRLTDQVMSLDIFPTVLDLVGIQYQEDAFEGRSLAPLLRSNSSAGSQAAPVQLKDRAIFSENVGDLAVAVRQGHWFFQKEIRDDTYSKNFGFSAGRLTLYDELEDPQDTKDVSKEHPDIVTQDDLLVTSWLAEKRRPRTLVQSQDVDPSVRERLRALGYTH